MLPQPPRSPCRRCCRRFQLSPTAPTSLPSPGTLALTGLRLHIRGVQTRKLKTTLLCPPTPMPALAASASCPAARADPRRRQGNIPREGVFRRLHSTFPRAPLPRDDGEAVASLLTILSLNTNKRADLGGLHSILKETKPHLVFLQEVYSYEVSSKTNATPPISQSRDV
jgi:hypothetical protein